MQKIKTPLVFLLGIFLGFGIFVGFDLYQEQETFQEDLNETPITSLKDEIKETIEKKREIVVSRHENGEKKIVSSYAGEGIDEKLIEEYRFNDNGELEYFHDKKTGIIEYYMQGHLVKREFPSGYFKGDDLDRHSVHLKNGFREYETWFQLLTSNTDNIFYSYFFQIGGILTDLYDNKISNQDINSSQEMSLNEFLQDALRSSTRLVNGKMEKDWVSDYKLLDDINKYQNNNYPDNIRSYLSNITWHDNGPGGSSTPLWNMESNALIPYPRANPHVLEFVGTSYGSKYPLFIREVFVGSDFTDDGRSFKRPWVEANTYVVTKVYPLFFEKTGNRGIDLERTGNPLMIEIRRD